MEVEDGWILVGDQVKSDAAPASRLEPQSAQLTLEPEPEDDCESESEAEADRDNLPSKSDWRWVEVNPEVNGWFALCRVPAGEHAVYSTNEPRRPGRVHFTEPKDLSKCMYRVRFVAKCGHFKVVIEDHQPMFFSRGVEVSEV